MEFESIGGNARCSMYSLYDYSNTPYGEGIMCIEVNRITKTWWFVGKTASCMNEEHMKALSNLLQKLLSSNEEFCDIKTELNY